MAKTLLVLEEAVALLRTVGGNDTLVNKFEAQARFALQHKARGRAPDDSDTDHVSVSAGYGAKSQRGFVELVVNDVLTQMDAAKAREIGLMLIQASEAAISDEIVMKLLREKVGLTDANGLGAILVDLREIRQGTRGVSHPS